MDHGPWFPTLNNIFARRKNTFYCRIKSFRVTSKQIEPRISFSSRSIHSVFSCPGLVMATCRHLQRMSLPISPTLSTLLCVFIVQSLYWSPPICEVDNFLASKSGIKGKPLFEMCCFHMGIAQIALDPPALCQTGKRGKKVLQTIQASL